MIFLPRCQLHLGSPFKIISLDSKWQKLILFASNIRLSYIHFIFSSSLRYSSSVLCLSLLPTGIHFWHWTLNIGHWTFEIWHLTLLEIGHWTLDIGHLKFDIGHWTLDIGHWTLDIGHWTLDIRHWTLKYDIGHWKFKIWHLTSDIYDIGIIRYLSSLRYSSCALCL